MTEEQLKSRIAELEGENADLAYWLKVALKKGLTNKSDIADVSSLIQKYEQ